MAKDKSGKSGASGGIPKDTMFDAGLADIENAAERARAANDAESAAEKAALAKRDSCLNCRTGDWRSLDGKYCFARRMKLDPQRPVYGCPSWRRDRWAGNLLRPES